MRALTSRKNLVKYGFLSEQIGSLVQYKKFHKGRVVKPKTNEEGADYWSDSEDEYSEDENTNTDMNDSQVVKEEGAFSTHPYSLSSSSLLFCLYSYSLITCVYLLRRALTNVSLFSHLRNG